MEPVGKPGLYHNSLDVDLPHIFVVWVIVGRAEILAFLDVLQSDIDVLPAVVSAFLLDIFLEIIPRLLLVECVIHINAGFIVGRNVTLGCYDCDKF
jgi:Na+-translocating ferredoxin:NAD+ oxidoreductase RnfE subunit